jgi:hypothetical protein
MMEEGTYVQSNVDDQNFVQGSFLEQARDSMIQFDTDGYNNNLQNDYVNDV